MVLSPETIKLRQERKRLSQELHDPTPKQKAEEKRYWSENRNLFAKASKRGRNKGGA